MKELKPYEEVEIGDYPFFTTDAETGKITFKKLPVAILTKYLLNKKLKGKYIYKDYAEKTEDAFDNTKGMLRIYNEALGIFELADNFLNKIIKQFFLEDLDTLNFLKCCSFASNKNNRELVSKIMFPSCIEEINRQLERLGNHWNTSFFKGYLAISFKNGTLILNTINKKVEFKEEHNPNYLASIYLPIEYTEKILQRTNNRLLNYIDFKMSLESIERKDFFKAMLFDYIYTENKSHHIICFNGEHGSGKSTFKEHLMGFNKRNAWCSELNLKSLVGSKFGVPQWFYSNCIFCNETSEKYFEDNATFKQLIAKEMIAVEQKGLDVVYLKTFSKVWCIGEEPIRVKMDGGADDRMLNFNWKKEHYDFKDEERYSYKEYYKQINETDETGNDALLQYLAFEKYEDFTQAITQGFEVFCRDNYSDNRRSFRRSYEKLFDEEMEKFARQQMSYLSKYESFFEDNKYCFIATTTLKELVNNLNIEEVGKSETLKQHLKMLSTKLKDYKNIKYLTRETSDKKIKLKNGNEFKLIRRTDYTFGLNFKELQAVKELIANNKRLIGDNTQNKFNNINSYFNIINEEDYNILFGTEETPQITPHGQGKKVEKIEKTVDEMAEELNQFFKVE